VDHPTPDAHVDPPGRTLPVDAGKPIVPAQETTPPWRPGEPWRPGGGIHGHRPSSSAAEPLAGLFAAPAAPAAPTRQPSFTHAGGPPQPPRGRTASSIALGLIAGVIGSLATVAALAAGGVFDENAPVPASVVAGGPEVVQVTEILTPEDVEVAAAAVARKVIPSIVSIEIGVNGPDEFLATASGSGVVISDEGRIITNRHVIDGAEDVRVVFQDGRIFNADIIGTDALTDLAVLEIDAIGLIPVEIGASDDLAIGDPAIAVGNPLGLAGGASVTVGVVSAFNREVVVGPTDRLFGMLQTDAPITRGSSGGALVDSRGRLIGITTAIGVSDAGAEGIGFAIPVELAIRITDELAETGTVRHAFLGVGLENFFFEEGPARVPGGATVERVENDSAADEYGLEVGDRIIGLDGDTVTTNQDVINTLRRYRVGDEVILEVVRGDQTLTVELVLGQRPEGV
jgi:putative serine protease PepD